MKRVITFGTFDLLHDGHLRILERARALGDHLIVGVSTDRLNAEKGKRSFFDQDHRAKCVEALKFVDEVFFEDSLEQKDDYIRAHRADLLVMGDDWAGKFDWVSCEVSYLPRTPGISSTDVKVTLGERFRTKRALFGDTYVKKHYECAMSLVNELTSQNIAPIFTNGQVLPPGVECDCLVYFNLPAKLPPDEYRDKPRILIDHGASNLKWFLGNQTRYDFFDVIVTAGPDHVHSLLTFFPGGQERYTKVRSAGFIKSKLLLGKPQRTREEVCASCGLDPAKPIVFFAPTWHISNNGDMAASIREIAAIENHVATLHPETVHLDVSGLNVISNENGITSELLKHADCVISDLSSTIFEAAALGKPVVQIALREYSDNNATMYDFPYVAGSADLFCGGLVARPGQVAAAVESTLRPTQLVSDGLSLMRERILKGTTIRDDSSLAIVAEIDRAADIEPEKLEVMRSQHRSTRSLDVAHGNLFFAKNRLIAHGAGDYDKWHASNSFEAISAALRAVDVVELDFVRGADGVIVAHDTFEQRYGFERNFRDIPVSEFLESRYEGKLRPVSMKEAISLCARNGKALVCDVKGVREEYAAVAAEIAEEARRANSLSRVVLQCYNQDDFKVARQLGFQRVLLAVWKYFYKDPLGEKSFDFLRECLEIDAGAVVGMSMPYQNKHMPVPSVDAPELLRFMSLWKRIYVHGAPKSEYPRMLDRNLGIFADGFSDRYAFQDLPHALDWRQYLFLNPDVVAAGHSSQVGAAVHFLRYGQEQGRKASYEVPEDFGYAHYLDCNPGLRKAGIGGVDSAKAHWTLHGHREGRRYRA